MSETILGYFHMDLYRLGNFQTNKIDAVRDRDIEEITFFRVPGRGDSNVRTGHPSEVQWIHAGPGGGISLFDDIQTAPITGKHWYCIPAGVKIPDGLALHEGRKVARRATHYTIYSTAEIPLDNFKLLLRVIATDVKIKAMFDKTTSGSGR